MAVESELKLRIAPEHMARLKRHPLLKKLASTRPVTHKLYNVYYDTPSLDLHQRAMALRLRRNGRQWLQTLKGGGGVRAGLHQRNEWEMPVAGEALDMGALADAGAPRLPRPVLKKLQPLFTTDFTRVTRMLAFEGSEIELCMDSGEIRAGKAKQPISEIELELKSGEPVQLFRLAQALLDIVPLEVEHTSKAEYGYRLFTRIAPEVVKASSPNLSACHNVAEALQAMIWSCMLHLQANVPGAVRKLDEEYLHQVRVALRRLRVVLAMAETCRADDELSALHEEVAGLCVEFGRLREWDVFVTQILPPIRKQLAKHAELHGLLHASEKLRSKHHDNVQRRLQSQEYQGFLLRFGAWMNGDYWNWLAQGDSLTLMDFATQIMDKRSRQVGKRGKKISAADPGQLHSLRIACKKLRYGAEIFATLFEGKAGTRYLSALAGLQDVLGTLNDIVVTQRLLEELDAEGQHEPALLVRGWLGRDYLDRRARLTKAWKKFSRQEVFWRD